MEKLLPLFPLNLVVFPGEELNLHIFEPRYKQLINDCLKEKSTFGIPSHVINKIEYGTEVKITSLEKTYSDGRMDIKTLGVSEFKVVEFHNPMSGKLYSGGVVDIIEIADDADPKFESKILEKAHDLFRWLQVEDEIDLSGKNIYQFIHKIGLKPEEEYQLLKTTSESLRQRYIYDHLVKILPALERAEKAKEKIRMNGHFKHLDPLKF